MRAFELSLRLAQLDRVGVGSIKNKRAPLRTISPFLKQIFVSVPPTSAQLDMPHCQELAQKLDPRVDFALKRRAHRDTRRRRGRSLVGRWRDKVRCRNDITRDGAQRHHGANPSLGPGVLERWVSNPVSY
jgi:hypothetical protein